MNKRSGTLFSAILFLAVLGVVLTTGMPGIGGAVHEINYLGSILVEQSATEEVLVDIPESLDSNNLVLFAVEDVPDFSDDIAMSFLESGYGNGILQVYSAVGQTILERNVDLNSGEESLNSIGFTVGVETETSVEGTQAVRLSIQKNLEEYASTAASNAAVLIVAAWDSSGAIPLAALSLSSGGDSSAMAQNSSPSPAPSPGSSPSPPATGAPNPPTPPTTGTPNSTPTAMPTTGTYRRASCHRDAGYQSTSERTLTLRIRGSLRCSSFGTAPSDFTSISNNPCGSHRIPMFTCRPDSNWAFVANPLDRCYFVSFDQASAQKTCHCKVELTCCYDCQPNS